MEVSMKLKAYDTMNRLCEVDLKLVVGHYTLPCRKVVDGVYKSQYKVVTINSSIYYIDCDIF